MAFQTSTGTGRFTAGNIATGFSAGQPSQDAYYYDDSAQDLGLPPVVYMGGGGTLAVDDALTTGGGDVVIELTVRGFTVYQPSVPWLFGNAEAVDRVDDAVAYAVGTVGSADLPPVIVGVSNGGVCGLQWSRQADDVAGLVLLTTPISLQDARDNTDLITELIVDIRGKIDDAWGVTYPAPLPANADPWPIRDDWLGIPVMQGVATDDLFGPGYQQSFGVWVAADLHMLGRSGHTVFGANGIPASTVASFVEAHI